MAPGTAGASARRVTAPVLSSFPIPARDSALPEGTGPGGRGESPEGCCHIQPALGRASLGGIGSMWGCPGTATSPHTPHFPLWGGFPTNPIPNVAVMSKEPLRIITFQRPDLKKLKPKELSTWKGKSWGWSGGFQQSTKITPAGWRGAPGALSKEQEHHPEGAVWTHVQRQDFPGDTHDPDVSQPPFPSPLPQPRQERSKTFGEGLHIAVWAISLAAGAAPAPRLAADTGDAEPRRKSSGE